MNKHHFYNKVLLFQIVFSLLCLSGYSQIYYVATTGSDGNTKTQAQNTATAWKTIQHACNNAAPGTTIEIMAGTYIEQINIPVSGSAGGGYITLTNYNGGKAIISGNATAATLLTISNQSYIKITGLEFYNCIGNNSIGILVDGVTSNIEITNNTIHHIYWNASFSAVPNSSQNAQPLIAYGDSATSLQNLIIQGNNFYDNATGFSETCSLDGNINGFSIINNMIHNNQNIGIVIAGNYGTSPNPATDHARNGVVKNNTVWKCHSVYDASAAGIYIDGGKNTVIEQNECYNNDWGIEVGCEIPGDTTANIKVRDNILYRNGGGMQVGGYDGPVNTGRVINSTITNNTFFANDTLVVGNGELSLSYSENCSFYNNIFYSKSDAVISSGWNTGNSKGFQFDYNRYYSIKSDSVNATFSYGTFSYTGFTSYKSGSGFDAHSVFTDPSLTDTSLSALNFHLLTSSSCINEGMPAFPADTSERDFYGNVRIVGSHIDIGADEYQSPSGLAGIDDIEAVKIYPNPATHFVTVELPASVSSGTVKIIDMFGENVITEKMTGRTLNINTDNLAQGVYCILVNEKYCSKIIKQ